MLKGVNAKKTTSFDKIPPKVVNLSEGFLATPLSETINNSISKGIFPNEVKIVLVSPPDEKHQTEILIYTLGQLLYYLLFSKIFDKVIINYLMEIMDNDFLIYLSTCRAPFCV